METKVNTLSFDLIKRLHWAIHYSDSLMPKINGKVFRIRKTSKQHLKQIVVNLNGEKIKFTEQSVESGSYYAIRALKGAKITWGIRTDNEWLYIDDRTIKIPKDIKVK